MTVEVIMVVGVYHMNYKPFKKLTLALSFAGTLFSVVNAAPQSTLESITTLVGQIKKENPVNEKALEGFQGEVIKVAKEAGFGWADYIVLSSFADRCKFIAGKSPIILNALIAKFIEKILPKHEQTIIKLMQDPALQPVRTLLDEQFESFDLSCAPTVKTTTKPATDVNQKIQKLNNFINDYQGQFHKLLSVVLTVGVYAETLSGQSGSHSYQELFQDIKNVALEVAAEHLEHAEIDNLIRFAKSNAYQKLTTRYEQLAQVVIKVLKPKYQEIASTFWNQTKSYVSRLIAATA
jgi:hypothetical protein